MPSPSDTNSSSWFSRRLLGSFAHLPRTIGLVWHATPSGLIVVIAIVVASATLPVALAWVAKLIVDAVYAAHTHASGAEREAALALIWKCVVIELALALGVALTDRGLVLMRQFIGAKLGHNLRLSILRKALSLELRHFENPVFYDKLTRARREISSRPLSLLQQSFQVLRSILTVGAYIALLVRFSPWMVVALLFAALPVLVMEARFSDAAFSLRNRRSRQTRQLDYLEHVLASDQHVKELKLLNLGSVLLERYRGRAFLLYAEELRLAWRRAGWAFGLSLLATLVFYGCYAAVALAAARGYLSLGDMTLYIVAFRQSQSAFQSLLTALGSMYEDNLYMSNFFDYLAIPTDAKDAFPSSRASTSGRPLSPEQKQGIYFAEVGFRYPDTEAWALRHVSVHIPTGNSIAVVGTNGAGKTTFIKLLTRLYLPTEGLIFLDGRDLQDWDEQEMRRRISVMFQDFNRYQFSLRDNVSFGSLPHAGDGPRIARALERGGASYLVAALAAGLDTELGRSLHNGAELSGGEWQKVALARCFMREEADILVLDEPTASLDPEAECAIFERFRAIARGRTTIFISHRFATVRMADKIIVLEQGRVIEHGTHAELLAAKGRYAHLYTLQAAGYY